MPLTRSASAPALSLLPASMAAEADNALRCTPNSTLLPSRGSQFDTRDQESMTPVRELLDIPGLKSFLAITLLNTMAQILVGLLLPDVSVSALNGGTDPCVGKEHSSAACEAASAKAAALSAFANAAPMLSVLLVPVVALVCDKFGRRPMILVCLLSSAFVNVTLVAVKASGLPIACYFIMRSVASVLPAQLPVYLWIADKVRPQDSILLYCLLGAGADAEGIVGPALSSILPSHVSLALLPIFNTLAFLVAWMCLPESKTMASQQLADWRFGSERITCHSFSARDVLSYFQNVTVLFTHPAYWKISLIVFMRIWAHVGGGSQVMMYFKLRYGLTVTTASPIMMVASVSCFFWGVLLVKPLTRCLGLLGLLNFCFSCGTVLALAFTLAPSASWYYPIMAVGGTSQPAMPTIYALYMSMTREDMRAQVQASLQVLTLLAGSLGSVMIGAVMSFFATPRFGLHNPFPEVVWVVVAATNFVCAVLLCIVPDLTRPPLEAEVKETKAPNVSDHRRLSGKRTSRRGLNRPTEIIPSGYHQMSDKVIGA